MPVATRAGGADKANGRKPAVYADEKSDTPVVPEKVSNKGTGPAETVEERGVAEGNANESPTYRTQSRKSVSMGLEGVRQRARSDKRARFTSLLHHVTPSLLVESFYALRKNAATGVDNVTWREYEGQLHSRVHELHREIHTGAYKALPSRRVYIPKADGSKKWPRLVGHEFEFVKWGLCGCRVIHGAARRPLCRARACGAVGNPACHLCRLFKRGQVGEVERIRCLAVKRAVRTPAVVELQIAPDPTARCAHRVIGMQIHLLVLDRFPQPLDEHVVAPTSLAVHADGDAVLLEQLREFETGELAALVGVEDLRCAVTMDRLLHSLDAEIGRQRVRQAP